MREVALLALCNQVPGEGVAVFDGPEFALHRGILLHRGEDVGIGFGVHLGDGGVVGADGIAASDGRGLTRGTGVAEDVNADIGRDDDEVVLVG